MYPVLFWVMVQGALLISGQPLSYAAPGWRRPKLAASGQKASTERFLAACR